MLHLQHDNETYWYSSFIIFRQELRLALEKKEKELSEKNQRIQYLENQLVSIKNL